MARTIAKWVNSESATAHQVLAATGGGSATWENPSSNSTRETITQASHGFAAKDVIRHNGTSWVKAKADTVDNAEALGVVESVDGNDFTVVFQGKLTTTGLTANTVYFLDENTAGLLTTTEPSISKPMLFAISTTVGYVFAYRGLQTSDVGTIKSVEASTATSGSPNVLTTAESGKYITNEGATEKSYQELPGASAGLSYTFYIQDSDGMRITAATGDTIRINTSVSISGGYVESTTTGSMLTLTAINGTEWVSGPAVGTWSLEV